MSTTHADLHTPPAHLTRPALALAHALPPKAKPEPNQRWLNQSIAFVLQDKFDDSGWGCAYRSFQTIWSWFRRQHYVATPAPDHREIQRALVAASQRPPSFLGSREWIGALELGSLVEGVLLGGREGSYRVINVASGVDIPSKAREIAAHFDTHVSQCLEDECLGLPVLLGANCLGWAAGLCSELQATGASATSGCAEDDRRPAACWELTLPTVLGQWLQGSPIMIGGGVLAYTLLGIDFNEKTGDCAFLILDPHYTGADDLKKIRGGGAGWLAVSRLCEDARRQAPVAPGTWPCAD